MRLVHNYQRSIALLSDTHIGSRLGVCPSGYVTEATKNPIMANPGQENLASSFEKFWDKMDEMKVDTVFLVGDIMSGINFKEMGMFMMTTDINEQVAMATLLLKKHCIHRKTYVWSGTPYHESRDYRIHETLAKDLGGQFMGSLSNMMLKPSKKTVHVRHATTSAMIYPETVLGRDIMFLKEAEALGQVPKIDAIITGHRHSFIEIHKASVHYLSLPCWEAFTPYYKATMNYFKYQPDIGGALMLLDSDNRLRFMHFLYQCPKITDRLVSG